MARKRATRYEITRMYADRERAPVERTIKTVLTLAQAQRHCRDRETSSRTCTEPANVAHTEAYGTWFDGYSEE